MTYNSVSRSHVHKSITCCSSNLLSWDWCHLKAKMTLFNFDVHHLYWFILEVYEKSAWSWLLKTVKHLENFSKSKKCNLHFLWFSRTCNLKTMKNWTPIMLRQLKLIGWSIIWALVQSFWLLELQVMTLQSGVLGHFWQFFNNLEKF